MPSEPTPKTYGPFMRGRARRICTASGASGTSCAFPDFMLSRGLRHTDELMLCGCTAPLLLGVAQLVYRLDFIWTHGGLTHPEIAESSAAAFAAVWAVELFAVLLPGLCFLYLNARSLTPSLPPAPGVMRPSSRKRRT
jgi:hypothetical protein